MPRREAETVDTAGRPRRSRNAAAAALRAADAWKCISSVRQTKIRGSWSCSLIVVVILARGIVGGGARWSWGGAGHLKDNRPTTCRLCPAFCGSLAGMIPANRRHRTRGWFLSAFHIAWETWPRKVGFSVVGPPPRPLDGGEASYYAKETWHRGRAFRRHEKCGCVHW